MPNIPQRCSWLSWLQQIAGVLVLLCVGGCGAAGFVVTGQLIDGETGKPVPNAWVHQEWMLSERISLPIEKGGAGTFPCVDEQVVRTDAKGNFRFEQPPKLRYNPITRSASAYVTPLIPGYDIDRDKSKNQGESHQVVVAKRIPRTETRETFVLSRLRGLSGGIGCPQMFGPDPILNPQLSDETAAELMRSNVSLDELGEIYRKSVSEEWTKIIKKPTQMSKDELLRTTAYVAYRAYIEKQERMK